MKDPAYVVINDESQSEELRSVLRTPAGEITFPLSPEDKEIIEILEGKFDREENCAGLAAPQIGYGKRVVVFSCPDDEFLRNHRKDLTQFMDKVIWINPAYEGLEEDKHEDYEGCFSVADMAGPVKRYSKVRYEARLMDGTKIEGIAEGFLARIIQHEVDHLNGTLFIDYVEEGRLKPIEQLRAEARARLEAEEEG